MDLLLLILELSFSYLLKELITSVKIEVFCMGKDWGQIRGRFTLRGRCGRRGGTGW